LENVNISFYLTSCKNELKSQAHVTLLVCVQLLNVC